MMSDEFKKRAEKVAQWWKAFKPHPMHGPNCPCTLLSIGDGWKALDALVAAMPDPRDELCEAALALADKIKGKSFRLVTLQVDDYTTTEGEQSDELARLCVAANAYKQSKGEG